MRTNYGVIHYVIFLMFAVPFRLLGPKRLNALSPLFLNIVHLHSYVW
jgi:hypothetical protein